MGLWWYEFKLRDYVYFGSDKRKTPTLFKIVGRQYVQQQDTWEYRVGNVFDMGSSPEDWYPEGDLKRRWMAAIIMGRAPTVF